jgi:hypothetical protein
MKDKMSNGVFQEFTSSQKQIYRATVALYQASLDTARQARDFQGGMHWKQIRGREYLYRYWDRLGHGESLGPRSEMTDKIFAGFAHRRREVMGRLRDQRQRLVEQARLCRAAQLPRVDRTAAKILRRLEQQDLGRNLLVIGSAALAAYEFAAEVFLAEPRAGSRGRPFPRSLSLAGDGRISWEELLRLLRRADRSFAPGPEGGCQAVNRDGFLVRLLKPEARPGRLKTLTVPGAREPLPPEAGNLQHLVASPKFSQVVVGQDGSPATLVAPDPRAFALNRLWLSQQEDRGAARRARDLHQALAVATLTLRHLPQYDFSSSELEMFPREFRLEAEGSGEEPTEDELIEYRGLTIIPPAPL